MWRDDPAGMTLRFKQAVAHVAAGEDLHPGDLKLPIFPVQQYVSVTLPGYKDGVFNPLELGVAYLVRPPERRTNTKSYWTLKQVRTPLLLHSPDRPSALQHLYVVEEAAARSCVSFHS